MRVKEERGGWFIEAHTSDEQERLEWLIESLQSHPDQQACETPSSTEPQVERSET